jgi:hypothetical protein
MSAAELVAASRKFDHLSILETELIKRLDVFVQEEARKQARTERFFARANEQVAPEVRKIVDWAKAREVKQMETEQA